MGFGQLNGHQARRPQPADRESLALDGSDILDLIERNLHAHGQFQGSNLLRLQETGHLEQVANFGNDVLGVAALSRSGLILPKGYPVTRRKLRHSPSELYHFARRFMSWLTQSVRILHLASGHHGSAIHDMDIPLRASRHTRDLDQNLAFSWLWNR